MGGPISICAEDACETSDKESDIDEYAWSSSRPLNRPLAFLESAARVEHETEDYDEDNPYKIDIDWPPVRAVSAMPETSKAVDVAVEALEDRGGAAPQRWVPWARGAYDPEVHGCSSGLRKK